MALLEDLEGRRLAAIGSMRVSREFKGDEQPIPGGGRTKFVTFRGAYHGDTTGAMAVSDPKEGMHRTFGGGLPHSAR